MRNALPDRILVTSTLPRSLRATGRLGWNSCSVNRKRYTYTGAPTNDLAALSERGNVEVNEDAVGQRVPH